MIHIGLYLSNSVNRAWLIDEILFNNYLKDFIDLEGVTGEVHSTSTIDRYIDEEIRHDTILVNTASNSTLQSMSSGQRRKALLDFLLTRKPGFLILDDLFGSIDSETRQYMVQKLVAIKSDIRVIQLFYRKPDVLEFIPTVINLDETGKIVKSFTRQQFLMPEKKSDALTSLQLPQLLGEHHYLKNPLIRLNQVSASYEDKPVLNEITWTIHAGEFWQLKGPVGCGKSTLLSMITGDNPRGFGQDMILFGKKKGSGETLWDIRRQIGFFTPSMLHQFHRDFSIENMIVGGLVDSIGLYIKPSDLQKDMAKAWMETIGIKSSSNSFQHLSFGQQRMVLVARAMIKHPPLLILDEPTVGLDDHNADLFIQLIKAIAAEKQVSILYVSHRTEPEIIPDKIFELIPTALGSIGKIR